eukprot:scaffold50683_cov52-Phaeocystis_antarctica.AAC.8
MTSPSRSVMHRCSAVKRGHMSISSRARTEREPFAARWVDALRLVGVLVERLLDHHHVAEPHQEGYLVDAPKRRADARERLAQHRQGSRARRGLPCLPLVLLVREQLGVQSIVLVLHAARALGNTEPRGSHHVLGHGQVEHEPRHNHEREQQVEEQSIGRGDEARGVARHLVREQVGQGRGRSPQLHEVAGVVPRLLLLFRQLWVLGREAHRHDEQLVRARVPSPNPCATEPHLTSAPGYVSKR